MPLIGTLKGIIESITGKTILDGTELSTKDRILGIIPLIEHTAKLGYKIDKIKNKHIINAGDLHKTPSNTVKNSNRFVNNKEQTSVNLHNNISTPYGLAVQEGAPQAINARIKVEKGQTLYRIGKTGTSNTGVNAQFWYLEHPYTVGYSKKYGIPQEHIEG